MTTTREQIHVSREWLDLLKRLPAAGRIIVIGPSDAGKTTLCRWLLSKLPAESRPALVDCDPGQSRVGPPGCVAWRFAGTNDHEFFFVGDTTPATTPATALAQSVRCAWAAEAADARLVLVDTSGYISGRGGLELKCGKLELLSTARHQPQVIMIGDSPEIRRLLAAWRNDDRLVIHRLPHSDHLRQKTREQRTAWRVERWTEQFAGLDLRRISLQGKALSGLPTASELQARKLSFADLPGLLLGFHDRERRGLCLGLLQSLDLRGQELLARAPKQAEDAPGLQFGLLRLTPEGQELGRII